MEVVRWLIGKLIVVFIGAVIVMSIIWVADHPQKSSGAVKHQGGNVSHVVNGLWEFVTSVLS